MTQQELQAAIAAGHTALGLELGSTNIKAVLVASDATVIASASHGWENELVGGVWTYSLDAVWSGIADCYARLSERVQEEYQAPLTRIGSIGISAMMHGYLAFDSAGEQLAEFRTWRNTITADAAARLTETFSFNIPQRWSIAHLYQAILNGEPEVARIDRLTTLAGYVHYALSGEHVLGLNDASGMFPIDTAALDYDERMVAAFDALPEVAPLPWTLREILPQAVPAGKICGHLTAAGARLLDPTGALEPGSIMAPPEGDAGTGMVSTNAVRVGTGNISVGTSAFSMNVLDAPLASVHTDIDLQVTPDGAPVAMVHANNCSSDLNAWVGLFSEAFAAIGARLSPGELYGTLLKTTQKADPCAGGIVSYGALSGETVTRIEQGRPLVVRTPHAHMTLANFMLAQLYGAFAPLAIGMDILRREGVRMDSMVAQGGLFNTPIIAQQALADILDLPITIMETAGSGGPWGMAVLALYARDSQGLTLADYLDKVIFRTAKRSALEPTPAGAKGAKKYLERYHQGLPAERLAAAIPDNE